MAFEIVRKAIEFAFFNPKRFARNHRGVDAHQDAVILPETRFRMPGFANRVRIGAESMVGCRFIFESEGGEIRIGERCYINPETRLISRSLIEIGDDVTIAWGCTIYDHDSHSLDWEKRREDVRLQILDHSKKRNFLHSKDWSSVASKPITIESKVWIGFGSTILKGVTIGEGAIVGAGSVVRQDIPAWSVVIGNPAVVVRTRIDQ
jgi:acetyltransferase-like isoleucine patch superfamily enzyme